MKVIIDTNVLLSAVIRDRLPEKVVMFCLENDDFRWMVTREILTEYHEVIRRPKFGLPETIIERWIELVNLDTVLVQYVDAGSIDLPRDRKDIIFLECAIKSEADFLISGDSDFSGVILPKTEIVSVSNFAKKYKI